MSRRKGIFQVPPWNVLIEGSSPYPRDVKQQMDLLNRQGQIEPLLARFDNEMQLWVINDNDWPYAKAQVQAARDLDWPTIIVTEDED